MYIWELLIYKIRNMKKLLLSSVVVFGLFAVAAAQNGKSVGVSKAQYRGAKTTPSPANDVTQNKQLITEAEAKAASKREKSLKSPSPKTKVKAAMSLAEAQK